MDKKRAAEKVKELYRGLGWPSLFVHIRFFTAPYKELERLIPKKGFVIDLGCGYGIFSNFLGLTGPEREILGIELDQKKINFADHGVSNVRFLQTDITKTRLKKADVILLIHVLHHLSSFKEQEELIEECRKKLKKHGRLIVVEVDRRPLLKYILGWLTDRLLYFGDKIYYRFPKEFLNLFSKLAFKVKMVKLNKGTPFAHVVYILKKDEKGS